MATIIYRKDESGEIITDKVPATRLHAALSGGWTVDKSELDKPKKRGRKPKAEKVDGDESES